MHNAECPCCGHGSETTRINHTTSIFDCLKLDDVRSGFFQRLETILPERAICRTRSAWLCSWGMPVIRPPQPEENENLLCRFLTSLLAPAGYPSGAGKKASRGLVYYVGD